MDRLTGNRLLGALAAVVVAAIIAMVAGLAIVLTGGRSDSGATLAVVSSPTATSPVQVTKDLEVPPLETPEPSPQGLFQNGQARYPSSEYLFENQWQWDLDGHHVQVYAGKRGVVGGVPGRGVVVVDVMSFDLQALPLGGVYQAPPGVGSLHIMSYQGTLLTLQAATGQTFYFDAESRAFTDANGNPVPTDAPTPASE